MSRRFRVYGLISLLPALAWIVPAALPHFPGQVVLCVLALLIGGVITVFLWLIGFAVWVVLFCRRPDDSEPPSPTGPSRYRSGY